ncbi:MULTISPECIES: ferredoxin III, nif-specific [Protofrankia]|uniref:Ferredoxin III n=1 Tax=Candidatus Protofrankia datiscae TaxID=2716812 RepID=F8B5C0_9ACTN|nr:MULTISPECIES: ferredoxin III, nif-specific [Protofrankia]AEH07972.1 ferredoxin III, nif-specific [Candidatus Protofrankia datiscae]
MSHVKFATRDGTPWVPQYIVALDGKKCIGCGRCYKVCAQGVLRLMGVNDEGELVDPFDDDEDIERKIMIIDAAGQCIGCNACIRVCGPRCQTYAPAEVA